MSVNAVGNNNDNNNNNNNNNNDSGYGAVIITIGSVHLVHLVNMEQRPVATNLWIWPTELGGESTCRLLLFTPTVAI